MPLQQIAAFVALTGFAGLTVFHMGLVLGAPLGHLAWGGRHRRLPLRLRLANLMAISVLAIGAGCLLEGSGVVSVFGWDAGVRVVTWGLVGVFGLGIIGNLASNSRAERRMGVPLSILLTVACLIVGLNP